MLVLQQKVPEEDCTKTAVMESFFRYPHTPHLAWLGSGTPRGDKVLSPFEARRVLENPLVLEEKLDGANIGISLDSTGELQVQSRGSILHEPFSGQFSRLNSWLGYHREAIEASLTTDLILFGEWCAATHSIKYKELTDWFYLFDVYSKSSQLFWSTSRRNALAAAVGIEHVPLVGSGTFRLQNLLDILGTETSRFTSGHMEGLVVRSENKERCLDKAKLVRAGFVQGIDRHWSSKSLQWNSLRPG